MDRSRSQLLDSYHARLSMQLVRVRTTSGAAAAINIVRGHHYRTCAKSAGQVAKLIGKCPMSDCYPTHCPALIQIYKNTINSKVESFGNQLKERKNQNKVMFMLMR